MEVNKLACPHPHQKNNAELLVSFCLNEISRSPLTLRLQARANFFQKFRCRLACI